MALFLQNEGEKYKDFLLCKKTPISELCSTLYELVHLPTGAQVMHVENEDPENLFCLSFQTLPKNSNGVAHILEHTVLCGSRKFPVKDPFFGMSKRSLSTFMNALTGADFTCYPAATQIEKDFYNLLEVYLDATFHPKLHKMSFLQEGHRLAFSDSNDPSSPLEIKGIVYNEMKGALSSVDSRMWHALIAHITPDLPYAFNSGGDPKEIPNLTYKELIEFHETYYAPARCLFYFYGNFPLKKHLDFIEANALEKAKKLPPLPSIDHQKPLAKPISKTLTYPTDSPDLQSKYFHTFGWLTTTLASQQEVMSLMILDSILMDTDASLLKKDLLQTNACVQADSFLDDEMTQVPYIFLFRGCGPDDANLLKQTLFASLEKIANEGIDYECIEASIHQLELARTEIEGGHSPFGLTLFMRSALLKQHGCDPIGGLTLHHHFKEIAQKAKDPLFFSPLIRKYLLENSHFVHLTFAPDPKLGEKEVKEEKAMVEKIKARLSDKDKAKILEEEKTLEVFQQKQEEKELSCLPKVTLDDVPAETRHYPLKEDKRKNLNLISHDTFTNKIFYADLVFDLPQIQKHELCDLELFVLLWSELGAGGRSYEENLQKIHAHTGGIGSYLSLHPQADNHHKCKPTLQIHTKGLEYKAKPLFELLIEMIESPNFKDKKRICELIKKLSTSMESRLSQNAMRYATHNCLASYSLASTINEHWYGLTFYRYIQSLASDLDQKIDSLIDRFSAMASNLFQNQNRSLILSTSTDHFTQLDRAGFYDLPSLPSKPQDLWGSGKAIEPLMPQEAAYTIPSPVAFSVEGFKAPNYTHPDAPFLQIATHLLENIILHHRIREIGGAYGAGANYSSLFGNFYLYSYRDPKLAHTLSTFSQALEEISSGNFTEENLHEAKLGVIGLFDTPTPPGSRAIVGYTWEREKKTRQRRQTFRDAIIGATKQQIQASITTHLLNQKGIVTTFGSKELFDKELSKIQGHSIVQLPIHAT